MATEAEKFGSLAPYADPFWYQRFHSPYYNDSHRKFRAKCRAFVEKEIMPHTSDWEAADKVPASIIKSAGKQGFLASVCGQWPRKFVPELEEPKGFDAFHELIFEDELSRCGSGGVIWGVCLGIMVGLPPILLFGNEFLQKKVAREVILGEKVIALAVSEPWTASDVAGLQTTADLSADGSHYVLSGAKKWITNGSFADYFTVIARTGKRGRLSIFLVEKDWPGVSVRKMHCTGMWGSGTAYLEFDEVRVPTKYRVGEEGDGFRMTTFNFNHERWGMSAQANRLSRVAFEDAFAYAMKRETFGKPLIEHQAIRFKLGDMARQIESTQALIEQITYQMTVMTKKRAMADLGDACAMLKVQATRTMEFVAREALHIFGGAGYR